MINTRHLQRVGLLAAFGASVAALSGCGGATTNSSGTAPTATPTIYGVNPNNGETGSGIESADAKQGYLTGSLSSTAKPLPGEGAFPLGFPGGGLLANSTASAPVQATAAPAGASVLFRALIANGNLSGSAGAIVESSVKLTSTGVAGLSQTLTFDKPGVGNGPVGAGQYVSQPFTLPAASGIYSLTASVSDVGGQSSATTLGVAVVTATNVALVVQQGFDTGTLDKNGNEVFNAVAAGDTITIDGGTGAGVYPAGYNAATAGGAAIPNTPDASGTIILFTTPGQHTITELDPKGVPVKDQTSTFTLAPASAGTTVYEIPVTGSTVPAPATPSVAKPHLVKRH